MRDRATVATRDWRRCLRGAVAADGQCVVRAVEARDMQPSQRLAVVGS